MMKKFFTPVVKSIKEHLKTLLRKPQLSKVQAMLLVSSFADSAFLQEEIKKEFSKRLKILIPRHATIAVVQGAVMFGKKPASVTERVISTTYGTNSAVDFIEGVHPEDKKFIADGIEMCHDIFSCFVKENKVIKLGQRITNTYQPVKANQTGLSVGFYVTSNPNTQFVTQTPALPRLGALQSNPQILGEVKTGNLKSACILEEQK